MRNSRQAVRFERPTRRLVIEQLEQRTYLTSRVLYISSEDSSPTFYTSVTSNANPFNPESLVFSDQPQRIVVAPNVHSIGPVTEWLKLDDPTLTVSAVSWNSKSTTTTKLQYETLHDGAMVGIRIQPNLDFSDQGVQISIRRLGDDPDSVPPLGFSGFAIFALRENPGIDLSLTVTTPDGSPIDQLHVGDDFILHVWAQDTRHDPHGVFAAYVNLNWQSGLANVDGQPGSGDHFANGGTGPEILPGAINHIGGFGGGSETKGGRLEVFSVPMHASAAGDLTISSSSADDGSPVYNNLEYGLDFPIDNQFVQFGKLSIHIADALAGQPPIEDKKETSTTNPPPNPTSEAPAVDLSVSVTTPAGLPINELHVGDNFVLHVWAQDTREHALGVFAAYLNLNWNGSLAALTGSTAHGEHFSNGIEDGSAAPGLLSRAGGFGNANRTKDGRYEVFSVPMRATAAGELSFATSSAEDGTPLYWILEHGIDGEIPLNDIQFGKFSVHVADALPGQAPKDPADTPTADPTNDPERQSSAAVEAAVPAIVVKPPAGSGEISVSVDVKELLYPEIKAAIAASAAVGGMSPALLSKSADAVGVGAAEESQLDERTVDFVSVVSSKDDGQADGDEACNEAASRAKLELSLL
jgi:hypothetical protein